MVASGPAAASRVVVRPTHISLISSLQNTGRDAPRIYLKQAGQRVTVVEAGEPGAEPLAIDIARLTFVQELPGLKTAAFPKPLPTFPRQLHPMSGHGRAKAPPYWPRFGTAPRGHPSFKAPRGFG